MVFQRPVAFRMSVSENVAYGLALRRVPRSERRTRVAEALELVGLGGFGDRRASTLSGGELQRVSIARCLVTDPEVLFLDEPTANLDPLSTSVIENVVAGLRKDRGITVVMATHNLEQGQRLCDRLAVMAGGRLVQIGTPLDLFYRPMSIDVAQFVGAENLVEGVVERMDRGVAFVRVAGDATLAVAVHAPVDGAGHRRHPARGDRAQRGATPAARGRRTIFPDGSRRSTARGRWSGSCSTADFRSSR